MIFPLVIFGVIYAFFAYDVSGYLSLANLKAKQAEVQAIYRESPALVIGIYAGIYILTTALSMPSPALLTLISGAIFGLSVGTIIVSISSTIGATLSFLSSRFLLRDFLRPKFGKTLEMICRGVDRDGVYYLLAMRLNPAFPFFIINLGMGLTRMPLAKYVAVSWAGLLPATILYVNAGTQLGQVNSLADVLSPDVVASFAILSLFPIAAKFLAPKVRHWRETHE